jgi:AcrR family transcriptional regulator
MEAIAREVGVSKPVVYRAFPDLEALLIALIDREASRLLTGMADVAEQAHQREGAREPGKVWLTGMAQLVGSDPGPWWVVLLHEAEAPEYLRERVRRGRRQLAESLAYAVRPEEHVRTWFGSDDPDLAVQALLAICEHFVRQMLLDPDVYTPPRILSFGLNLIDRMSSS